MRQSMTLTEHCANLFGAEADRNMKGSNTVKYGGQQHC
jgi:hypothetical protein